MEKLTKTAKNLDTFFKVLQNIIKVAMIVVVCVLLCLTIANAVNPDAVIANGSYKIGIGSLSINLTEEYSVADNNMILIYAWIAAGLAIVAVAAIYYAIGQIRKILQPMMEGNPFHHTVSENIRKMAFVSIVLGIVANVASYLETLSALNMLEQINIQELVKDGKIESVTANFNMDVTFIVVFFLLLLVSYIFRYGETLQKQVDETL